MTDLSPQQAHRDYVSGALLFYEESGITPGDPSEGKWEHAHYPVPKRLGGTETILLLKEHHGVQGVLQSEEFDVCCVSGKYDKWLRGSDYEDVYLKWLSVNGTDAGRVGGASAYLKRGKLHVEAAAEAKRKKVLVEKEGYAEEFVSLTAACKKLGLTKSAMSSVIAGKRNHHKGYTAHYV